jgi:two-component system LytT family response regulator
VKALIVDDEAPARVEMRKLLSLFPEVEVIGDASDVDAALELTARHRPEICFLDIQLAGESGFDYVAQVGGDGPRIVFITAHDRYAVRGFECNAMDYLLKPVRAERLAETLRRLPAPAPAPAKEHDLVFLKGASTARFVPWSEVRRIESKGNYSSVHLVDGSSLMMLRTLKQWADLAPTGHFLQIHRSILIRPGDIRELRLADGRQRELILLDGACVPVGRTFWSAVQRISGMK